MPQSSWQGSLDKTNIHVINVIGNHQHRSANIFKIVPTKNLRPTQEHHRRPHQYVKGRGADPCYRPREGPPWVVISEALRWLSLQQVCDFSDRICLRESSF